MNMKLQSTTNYGLFVANDDQRKLDQNHIKRLMKSMDKVGFIPSKPIQCYKRGDKLVKVDGHHRFAAAVNLGIPIYYVIESEESQHMIAAENFLVKKWNSSDFVRTFANRGLSDYLELIEYSQKTGLNYVTIASMLGGEQAKSKNYTNSLNQGTFKIKDRNQVNAYIKLKTTVPRKEIEHRAFVAAWSKCYFVEEFDVAQFTHKADLYQSNLTTCSNEDQALDMIEQIYNYKQSIKIPLAFLAKQNSKRRQAKFGHYSK